ncbi:U3 small nucleolar RNA-associated protein [Lactarius hatsudake]|nr:U3 small nucleolar RNA-associated protein [Lactarius hatsudake]
MNLNSSSKTAFKKARTIAPLYTGGPVAITRDGLWLVTCVGEQAVLTDLESGAEICRFSGDTESITALCTSPSGKHLMIFTASMALRIYELPTSATPITKPVSPIRVVARAHDAPVYVCKTDPTSTYLASGASDGTVKVWDIVRGFPTHVLRGHGGIVSAIAWSYPRAVELLEVRKMRLFTASVDTRIRVWDLTQGAEQARVGKQVKPEAVLEGHVSVPRGLDISEDGRWLVSGGRDQVVLVWDMAERSAKKSGKGKAKEAWPVLANTITALERVEAVGILGNEVDIGESSSRPQRLCFFTAGEKGLVRIWDGKTGHVIRAFGEEQHVNPGDEEAQGQILDAFFVPSTSSIVSVHADQNILFYTLPDGAIQRQLIGFNDEITDVALLGSAQPPEHVALATNSPLIRIYSTESFDARLLAGHRDIVLSLATSSSGRILASGAKDNSARLWARQNNNEAGWACVAICEGHAESVGAVVFEREDVPRFLFTGSQDRTIKVWDLSGVPGEVPAPTPVRCKSVSTTRAHEKDINALDSSPGGSLLVSGSQDKTAKIWTVGRPGGMLKLLGTCKGHKRGVWSVRFARGTRTLATGSGDRTVRLWRLDDFSCLKVFEGHANSVLRVDWLGGDEVHGQVVSASADGLVKVWDSRTEECVATLDGHDDKVWALTVSRDNKTIVSGAADSVVTFWEDCSEELDATRETARAELVLKEQDFLNYVALQDYKRAIEVALSLGHPGRLLQLFKGLNGESGVTGSADVDEVLRTLTSEDLVRLLRYIRDWNTRASSAAVAQRVLHAIMKHRQAEDIARAFENAGTAEDKDDLRELVEGLIPYTERHLARMERLVQESYVVDYVLREMDDGLVDDDDEIMDVDLVHNAQLSVDVGA